MSRLWHMSGAVLLVAGVAALGAQNILKNGSMELGAGPNSLDPMIAADWIEFGLNVERSGEANLTPNGSGFSLKAFSDPVNTSAGAYQEFPVTPGQQVTITWSNYTRGIDKLGGAAIAGFRVEFRGAFSNLISFNESLPFDASAPADTWVPGTIGPIVAPAGTAKIQVYARLFWGTGSASGSVYWDGVSVLVAGVEKILNGNFETAGEGEQSPVGIDDWLGFNDQEKSEEEAHHGLSSAKLGTTEQFSGVYQQAGVVTDGERLLLKAKVLHSTAAPLTGNATAGIKLEFKASSPAVPPVENLAFNDMSTTNTWTLVELSATDIAVPEDITIARAVMIYVGAASSTGLIYFDSAVMTVNGGGNVLVNPSFENGLGGANGIDNWTEFNSGGSFAQLDCFGPAFAGDCACGAGGPAVAGIYQDVTVTTGDLLDLSVRMYMPSGTPLVNASAGLKIEWRGGNRPGDIDIGDPVYNPVVLTAGSPKDQWVDLEIDYTMPAGTEAIAQFTNLMAFAGGAATGAAYFDNCEAVVMNRFDGADADGDDDQDLADYAAFQRCFSGANGGLRWNCTVFDNDEDGDVDAADYGYFGPRMTGP